MQRNDVFEKIGDNGAVCTACACTHAHSNACPITEQCKDVSGNQADSAVCGFSAGVGVEPATGSHHQHPGFGWDHCLLSPLFIHCPGL